MDFATTTENSTENLATVLRRPPGDSNVPKGRESCDGLDLVGKAVGEKGSYIVCEEYTEERERGKDPIACPSASHRGPCDQATVRPWTEGCPIACSSASHRGPSDQATVRPMTEEGPISCPSPEKSNSSPSAATETEWIRWDCSCHGVNDLLGMQSCGCSDLSRFGDMRTEKDPDKEFAMEIARFLNRRARFY